MIDRIIKKYRQNLAIESLINSLLKAFMIFLILFFSVSVLETILYFTKFNREKIIYIYMGSFIITLLYILINTLMIYFSFLNNYSKNKIAKMIGREFPVISDKLINVLQINQNKFFDKKLVTHATEHTEKILQSVAKKIAKKNISKKNIYESCSVGIIILTIIFLTDIKNGSYRLLKFRNHFEIPTPFKLISEYGNFTALEGDSIKINIKAIGKELPDTISLFITSQDNVVKQNSLVNKNKEYNFIINNIQENTIYWASSKNKYLLSRWDEVKTIPDTIIVKNRPHFESTIFTINPPEYTKRDSYHHNESNITQIEILNGSNVTLNVLASNTLKSAWILNNNNRTNTLIDDQNILYEFIMNENMKLSVFCIDVNGISNKNPTQYNLIAKKDNPPKLIVRSPEIEFEINEQFNIPINCNILDDIGIKDVWIEYSIQNPDFDLKDSKKDSIIIKKLNENLNTNLLLTYNWDISNLNLLMGDELHFNILTQDNNTNASNITKSQDLIGRFPTLENIFSEIENYETSTEDFMDGIQNSIEDISDIAEDIKLDLLKSDEITWEQQQNLENTFSEIEEISEQIEKIQENIENIIAKAEENKIFDNQLLDKFEKFQDMLQDIMTPELLDAIQQLQEAMQNANMEKIIESLENYEFNVEQFEEQIDRFIDMFELALAEQKLNELSEHIENMINKQNQIIDDINNNADNMKLSKQSIKQEIRFNSFKTLLNESETITEGISDNTSNEIKNLREDSSMQRTEESLSKQSNEIKNKAASQINSSNSKKNLEEIADVVNELINQFNSENKNKMSKEFIQIINDLLTMSNQQEQINVDAKGLRGNSPKIREINKLQYNIDKELTQITSQLIDLSNKTFFVNPKINHTIGKLKSNINKTISLYEQKQISTAKKEQHLILEKINLITSLLILSMNEMQQSESTSGFEQFMESLEQISNQQQGINQGTMQMGQFGMMQQQMMQQLQEQQQKLKEKLEELIGNNPGEDPGGGLHQTTKEMDEIINDFKNRNVTQKTIDRQQKILSRMLDSQKSLNQKDFNNKRESKTAQHFEYFGPLGLPNNLGDKDLFLMNALENAMKEGLSSEYDKLIQTYFLNLQNSPDEN